MHHFAGVGIWAFYSFSAHAVITRATPRIANYHKRYMNNEVGCLTVYYLLDAAVSEKEQGIKLTFYNPSKNKWQEILDNDYRPYFFIPYPIPENDLKVIQELELGIEVCLLYTSPSPRD